MDTLEPSELLLLCECAIPSRHLTCDSLSKDELQFMLELKHQGLAEKSRGDWRPTHKGNALVKAIKIVCSQAMPVRDPYKYYETQAKKMENDDEKEL